MHGRLKVKTTKEQEEERKIREREKAYSFRHLSQSLFDLRVTLRDDDPSLSEIFKISHELLLMNPDFYTVWNIRREALLLDVSKRTEEADLMTVWRSELSFTMDCLRKNEKSYSVWRHRIWVLSNMPSSEYESEILLCNMFLTKDERNFHCWDYRSLIVDLAKRDIEKELEFTTEKINANFSNFSAWHRRHKLLIKGQTLPNCPDSCNLKLIWNKEYDMVLNALFTDPSDQSPWLYHNWLIKNNFSHLGPEHIENLKTLKEMEPDNRWVAQALDLAKVWAIARQPAAEGRPSEAD